PTSRRKQIPPVSARHSAHSRSFPLGGRGSAPALCTESSWASAPDETPSSPLSRCEQGNAYRPRRFLPQEQCWHFKVHRGDVCGDSSWQVCSFSSQRLSPSRPIPNLRPMENPPAATSFAPPKPKSTASIPHS